MKRISKKEQKRRDDFILQRDEMALQMHNKHFNSLTSSQMKNVSKEVDASYTPEERYSMKRDTLALQIYNDHFVFLTTQQKRNVTRKFNISFNKSGTNTGVLPQ